jgi:outer membrane protein assembly factor BamD (BamD/ComL family)
VSQVPSDLQHEVMALESARAALKRGDAAKALAALDRYDHDARQAHLGTEAMYLRMEAWLRQGDQAHAKNAARRLLHLYPEGPHAARARAVLGLTTP